MKKDFRILKNKDFERMFLLGRQIENKCFKLYYLKNDCHTRVGIATAKKIGGSVTRNLIKRQVRSILLHLDLEKNIDIIVYVKHHYLNLSYQQNREKLLQTIEECLAEVSL
jgi:ribonuclease P protein component